MVLLQHTLQSCGIIMYMHSTKLGLLEDLEDMRKEEEDRMWKHGTVKSKKRV